MAALRFIFAILIAISIMVPPVYAGKKGSSSKKVKQETLVPEWSWKDMADKEIIAKLIADPGAEIHVGAVALSIKTHKYDEAVLRAVAYMKEQMEDEEEGLSISLKQSTKKTKIGAATCKFTVYAGGEVTGLGLTLQVRSLRNDPFLETTLALALKIREAFAAQDKYQPPQTITQFEYDGQSYDIKPLLPETASKQLNTIFNAVAKKFDGSPEDEMREALKIGYLTIDEIDALRGLNHLTYDKGKKPFIFTLAPSGAAAQIDAPQKAKPKTKPKKKAAKPKTKKKSKPKKKAAKPKTKKKSKPKKKAAKPKTKKKPKPKKKTAKRTAQSVSTSKQKPLPNASREVPIPPKRLDAAQPQHEVLNAQVAPKQPVIDPKPEPKNNAPEGQAPEVQQPQVQEPENPLANNAPNARRAPRVKAPRVRRVPRVLPDRKPHKSLPKAPVQVQEIQAPEVHAPQVQAQEIQRPVNNRVLKGLTPSQKSKLRERIQRLEQLQNVANGLRSVLTAFRARVAK